MRSAGPVVVGAGATPALRSAAGRPSFFPVVVYSQVDPKTSWTIPWEMWNLVESTVILPA